MNTLPFSPLTDAALLSAMALNVFCHDNPAAFRLQQEYADALHRRMVGDRYAWLPMLGAHDLDGGAA